MFQGLIRPRSVRSESGSSATSRRLFPAEEAPPALTLPPPRNFVEDEISIHRRMSNSSTESDLSSIATRKSSRTLTSSTTTRANVDGLFYFEALVVSASPSSRIAIGIAEMDADEPTSSFSLSCVYHELPGKRADSWAYHNDGRVYPGGQNYGPTYGAGDVIGCGWDWRHGIVFFTKNGTRFPSAFSSLVPRHGKAYFPTIGVQNEEEDESVVVIAPNVYGARPFICATTHYVAGRRPPPPPPPRHRNDDDVVENNDANDDDDSDKPSLYSALTKLNLALENNVSKEDLAKVLGLCNELRAQEMCRITNFTTKVERFQTYADNNIEQCTFRDDEISDVVFRTIHLSEDVLRSSYRALLRLNPHMECLRT